MKESKNNKFEKLYEVNKITDKHYMVVFRFNGKKFKIFIEHSNGVPMGFNYKCAVSIMVNDGTFKHIADNLDLGFAWENCYIGKDGDIRIATYNRSAEKEFKNYIEKVYSE